MRRALAVFLALELAASGLVSAAAGMVRPEGQTPGFGARKAPNKVPLSGISQIPSNVLQTPLNLKSRELPQNPEQTPPVSGIPEGALQNVQSPLLRENSARTTAKSLLPSAKAAELLSDMAQNLSGPGTAKPGGNQEQELRSAFDGEKKADQRTGEPPETEEAKAGGAEILSPGGASAGKEQSHLELWQTMEKGLFKVLGAQNLPSLIEAWKIETANILRNDSSLSMGTALLKAFAKVHGLTPAQADILSRFPNGEAERVKGIPKTYVRRVVRIGDTLHAVTEKGLYAKGPGGWSKIGKLKGAMDAARYQGRLYVGTAEGLYVQEGSGWKPVEGAEVGNIKRLMLIGKELYVAGSDGLYKLSEGKRELEGKYIRDLVELGGVVYAGGNEGLYELGPRPRRILPHIINSITRSGDELVAATNKGIYFIKGEEKIRMDLPDQEKEVRHVVAIGKALYAAGSKGVYRKGKEGWEELPWYHSLAFYGAIGLFGTEGIHHLHETPDGMVYISTHRGLDVVWHWERTGELAEKDINGLLTRRELPKNIAAPAPSSSILEDGDRALFNGLTTR